MGSAPLGLCSAPQWLWAGPDKPSLPSPYKLPPAGALFQCAFPGQLSLVGRAKQLHLQQGPATCCLSWWSSWGAFPGFPPWAAPHPRGDETSSEGGLRPVANEANFSWHYFLNIGSLVPLHLKNKAGFLISLSTVCKLMTTPDGCATTV